MFVKAPEMTYLWRHKAPFKHSKRELLGGSGGVLPQEIFETVVCLEKGPVTKCMCI